MLHWLRVLNWLTSDNLVHLTSELRFNIKPIKKIQLKKGLTKESILSLREELKKRAPKDSIFDPPYSTLQVGGIFGGIAHNVIADKCHVNWETRPVIKEDGVFLNEQIDKFANEVLIPKMQK